MQGGMLSIRRVLAPNPSVYTLEGTNTWIVGSEPTIVIDPGPDMPQHLADVARRGRLGRRRARHPRSSRPRAGRDPVRTPRRRARRTRPGSPARSACRAGQQVRAGDLDLTAVHDARSHVGPRGVLRARSGALFTGDTVLGRGTSFIDPPDGDLVAVPAVAPTAPRSRSAVDLSGPRTRRAAGAREAPRVPRAP